jgi:hypothetical protein
MPYGPFRDVLLGTPGLAATGVTSGTSDPINCAGYTYLTVFYTSFGTTSGGTLILEGADYSDDPRADGPYSGTWGQIESRAASSFTGGVQLPVSLSPAAYGWIRVRISSAITGGGSVMVTMRGHV